MRPLLKTEADALALIAVTYSENRPDIHEALTEGELQAWDAMIFSAPATQRIARFYPTMEDTPDWNPELHLEDLEEYHYDNLGEEEAEQRQDELRQGAPLTEEEATEFARVWEESAMSRGVRIYYLHRVGPPFTTSDEQRSIYFLCQHSEGGQYSDLEYVTGPLRSLDEVLEQFEKASRDQYEFDDSMTDGEGVAFKEQFFAEATRASTQTSPDSV